MGKKIRSPQRHQKKGIAALWHIAMAISPGRSIIVLVCLLVAGLAEGIGIASLLPLVALMDGSGGATSGLAGTIMNGIAALGLPADPITLMGILITGLILKAGLVLLAMRQVGYAVAEVSARLRLDLVNSLLDAHWGFFVRQPIGRFAAALGVESTKAGEAYNAVAQFASNGIQAIVYVGIAAFVSWQLAVLALLIGLIMVLSLNRLVISARRNARKQTKRMKQMIGRLADVLIGIKPMKAMGRQARYGMLFQKDVQVINQALRRQVLTRQANKLLQEPIIALCLGIAIYGALRVWSMPVGDLLVMSLLMVKTVSMIGRAQQELQSAKIAETGYWAVRETVGDATDARERMVGTLVPTFERGVEFRNVSFAFGDKQIVADTSFVVRAGTVTAITGPSGIGKTTISDMILGLHLPDAGEVLIDGVPLAKLDVEHWRKMTGYVPQEVMLFHDSVAANVSLGQPELTLADVERALREAGAWEFVAQLPEGMDTIVGERGALLSGGQRQRIALARALVHAPKLLILDEATSALDPVTEATIVRNICELSQKKGMTVLSISHQALWAVNADIVLRFEDRMVVEVPRVRAVAS